MSRSSYEPLTVDKIVVDAVDSIDDSLARVCAHLGLGNRATPALDKNAGDQREAR